MRARIIPDNSRISKKGIKYLKEHYIAHYQLTPYTFKPNVALKIISEKYHDLGQGILDCIHKEYEELKENGEKTINWE